MYTRFIGESRFLVRLNQLKLTPLTFSIVIEAVGYVFRYGIYIADAVQIASAKMFNSFLTYDKRLAQIASIESLNVIA